MTAPVFYDPHQRRWRWFTRFGRAIGIFASLALIAVVGTVLVNPVLPSLGLPPVAPLPQHRLLPPRPERPPKLGERKLEATKVELRNERLRAASAVRVAPPKPRPTNLYAFFVNWDDTSFTSLRQNIGRIDVLVPEWLHLGDENGNLIENNPPRRQEVLDFVKLRRPDLRVLPLINNFNPDTLDWQSARIGAMLGNPAARARTIDGITSFVERHGFRGVNVDFEAVPKNRQPLLVDFMCELKDAFKPRGWTLSESVPLDDQAFDYKGLGQCTDRLVLMAYDEHAGESDAGPVASQAWFVDGVARRAADVGAAHLVVAVGNYGYDWIEGRSRSRQPAVVPGGDARGVRIGGPRRPRFRQPQPDIRLRGRARPGASRLVPRRRHRVQPGAERDQPRASRGSRCGGSDPKTRPPGTSSSSAPIWTRPRRSRSSR